MEVGSRQVIISVRELSYTYDGVVDVLKKISFDIRVGEVVSILGPNGAGKTTLLKCILGLLKPKGAVYVDGREVFRMKPSLLAKLVGYVPQIHNTVFAYRVVDYVLMGRAPYHNMLSLPGRSEYEKALRVLEDLGISDLANRTIAEISGGQLQLVLIARALVQEARILVLDEPTAHLDIANKVKVLNSVRKLVDQGKVEAAVMSLHDPQMAALFSDKIVLLSDGEILAYGTPRSVLTSENLRKAYGVEFKVVDVDGKILVIPETT